MAGPQEQRLAKAQSASPETVRASAGSWQTAAEGLVEVADALRAAKARIREAWSGASADVAVSAFEALATSVDEQQQTMRHAVASLETAASGLETAKTDYASLPTVLPMPDAPDLTGQDDAQSIDAEVRYLRQVGAHRQSVDARESQAAAANERLDLSLSEAGGEMDLVAPPPSDKRFGDKSTEQGTGSGGARSAGPGSGGSSGAVAGSPYPTGSGGTYVFGHAGGTSGVTSAAPGSSDPLPMPGQAASATADGPVDGLVSAGPATSGGSAAAVPAAGPDATPPGSGAVGGAVGAAGGAAGLRGVFGSLRGGTVAPGGSAAPLGRTAGGRVASSGVIGGSGASRDAEGGAGRGSSGARTPGQATAGGRTGAGAASSGARTAGPGASRSGATGTTSGARSATGTTSGARGSSGGASGGGSRSSGMRAGGRGAMSGQGAAGGRTGAAGRSDSREDEERSSITFEDDAWLDDEESGPGVLG